MDLIQSTTDFDQANLSSGDIVTNQLDGVIISTDADFGAMIFDTDIETGGDSDLAGAGVGNVLIISEDGDSSDPDDSADGGTIRFDWDEPVDIDSLDLLDIERPGTTVNLLDADDNVIETFNASIGDDGNIQTLDIDVDNVDAMEIFFSSTGAVANIITTSSNPAPVDPVDPIDPVDPVDPVDPIDPVDPVDPIDPIDPIDPVDPVDPIDPADPVDPVDPIDPIDPIDPVDPIDPIDPVDPVDPIDPVDPVDPTDPIDSVDSADSGETVVAPEVISCEFGTPLPIIEFETDNQGVPINHQTHRDDTLRGSGGANTIFGKGGDDNIRGGRKPNSFGRDRLYGGTGDDLIKGGKGRDYLNGGTGNDDLYGGKFRDFLRGGRGDDTLRGQDGEDILWGGRGDDIIIGGPDKDMIVYKKLNEGTDTIRRFNQDEDVIDLRTIFGRNAFAHENDCVRFDDLVDLEVVNGSTEIRVDQNGFRPGTELVTLAVVEDVSGLDSKHFVIS